MKITSCGTLTSRPVTTHRSSKLQLTRAGGETDGGKRVLILPGFLSGSQPYVKMAENVRNEGYDAEVLEIRTSEWYPTLIGGSFEWYVGRLADRIDALYSEYGQVILMGHSAGGWIARITLGAYPYMGAVCGTISCVVLQCLGIGLECNRLSKVEKLITLGAPHLSLENYPFGRFKAVNGFFHNGCKCVVQERVFSGKTEDGMGMWDSSLKFANVLYGDASKLNGLEIISIAGSGFKGQELRLTDRVKYLLQQGSLPQDVSVAAFAFTSYKTNCGRSDVDGDGVCPVETALLPGAKHIVLPGVFHGPNNYGLSWYGSQDAVSKWISHV